MRRAINLLNILIIITVLSFSTVSVFGQQRSKAGAFTIHGKIENFGNGNLIGTIRDLGNNSFRTDTIIIKNNRFNHTGWIKEKQIVSYVTASDKFAKYRRVFKDGDSIDLDFSNKRSRSIEIIISPGSKIKISGIASTYLDAYPSGTKENEQLAALSRKINPLADQLGNLDYTDKKKIRITVNLEDSLSAGIAEYELEFIKQHPSSIISSYLVWKEYEVLNKRDPAKADSLFSLITPAENNIYQQQILLMRKNRIEKSTELSVGDMFPAITSKLVYNGTGFDLHQAYGKYTLIDFWGTWCIPCVKEMPKLKAFYERFRDRLNIVGIADDQFQNWKAFLDRNNYEWTQILDQDIPKLTDRLNIRVFPTKYLLDPSGKILMIFKDANEEIWEKLELLLGPKS